MLRAASRINVGQVFHTQRRHSGGWFKKNIRVEENAGLRGNMVPIKRIFSLLLTILCYIFTEHMLSHSTTFHHRLFSCFLEISYKTWEFDAASLGRLFGYLIIPSALVYSLTIQENVIKNEAYGRDVSYGIVPFPKEE